MKKVLVFLLSMVLICSCILLISCNQNVVSIKFKEETIPTDVKQGDTIDYSKIVIVATYENETTKEFKLTDKGVTYDAISTATTGNQILTARFSGKSAQTTIVVNARDIVGGDDEITINGFANTAGYINYLEAKKEQALTNKEIEFIQRDCPYEVGVDNGYRIIPVGSGIDADGEEFDDMSAIKTTYALYLKGSADKLSGSELTKYLSKVEDNIYYFTTEAVGKEFKIEVTLSEEYNVLDENMSKTFTQEIKVVEGYNVYDALGLSVLDNLNVKSWANIKDQTLPGDSKKLGEYNDVKQVILHNDIELSKSDFPASYFWQKGDTAAGEGKGISYADALSRTPVIYKDLLEGSFKECNIGEAWDDDETQRGLFMNNGIGLTGNYLKISYVDGVQYDKVNGKYVAPEGGLYIVYDSNMGSGNTRTYPESHCSLICFKEYTDKGELITDERSALIRNVYCVGATSKTENTEAPAGLMMVGGTIDTIAIENVIASRWFSNITMTSNPVDLTVKDCRFYDSFSQMVFGYFINSVNIVNSHMKRAGGPLMVIFSKTQNDTHENRSTINLTVDETTLSQMENWVTGAEAWFKINIPSDSNVGQLLALSGMLNPLGQTYYKDGKCNLLGVVIPGTEGAFTGQDPVTANVTLNGIEYGMAEEVLNSILNLPQTATELSTLLDNLPEQITAQMNEQQQLLLQGLKDGASYMATSTPALSAMAPIYKSGSNYAYTPDMQNVKFSDIIAGVKQLDAGAKTIAQLLQGAAQQYTAAGDDATAAALNGLATQYTAWSNKVAPIASLVEVSEQPTDGGFEAAVDTAWKAGWKDEETPSYAVMWVNAAAPKDPSVKRILVLFGASVEATPAV